MKDKEKKHLLRWFLGLMEDRLPIYLFCILISSMGTHFPRLPTHGSWKALFLQHKAEIRTAY